MIGSTASPASRLAKPVRSCGHRTCNSNVRRCRHRSTRINDLIQWRRRAFNPRQTEAPDRICIERRAVTHPALVVTGKNPLFESRRSIHEGQRRYPLTVRPAVRHQGGRRRKVHILVVVIMIPQADLLQIVLALRASRGFAGLLDSRQQQRDQNCDDRDDYQQFDQSERFSSHCLHFHVSSNCEKQYLRDGKTFQGKLAREKLRAKPASFDFGDFMPMFFVK